MSMKKFMRLCCASQLKAFHSSTNAVVLDTETTGLDEDSEIVEISILNTQGVVLFNSLVKPAKPIPKEATEIHGITNEDVKHSPTWLDINEQVFGVLNGNVVGIYNANFDLRMIKQSIEIALDEAKRNEALDQSSTNEIKDKSAPWLESLVENSICIMTLFAGFFGQIKRGDAADINSYKWKKLHEAADHFDYRSDNPAHRATEDCLMTLFVAESAGNTVSSRDVDKNVAFYPAIQKLNKQNLTDSNGNYKMWIVLALPIVLGIAFLLSL